MLLAFIACTHALFLVILGANLVYLARRRPHPDLEALPRLSVLIPARNEERNLARLLPTLLRQRYPDFEVIVYDDGSEDGTPDVLAAQRDPRLRALRGEGPPSGWVGKVHALYQATRQAEAEVYLFLDADAELADADALRRLAARHASLPPASVLTGMTRLAGGGLLLVSLVTNALLIGLPWPLVRRLPFPQLAALNGQCWMLDAATYHRLEPHARHPAEVLEDVQIGRYLKRNGIVPVLHDVQAEVTVHMYADLGDAWQGLRKNAYLILGGTPFAFVFFVAYFALTFLVAPVLWLGFLATAYLIKGLTDRAGGFPLWVTLLMPLSYGLGFILQWHSALSHWTGRVAWKGRRV